MKRFVLVLGFLAISVAACATLCAAEDTKPNEPEYSTAQIKKMTRDARTVEQYTIIADYYARRQQMYKRKSAEEMHLWAERSAVSTPLSDKWPRPVDSARNLHDYYEYEASRSGMLFAKYSALADTAPAK